MAGFIPLTIMSGLSRGNRGPPHRNRRLLLVLRRVRGLDRHPVLRRVRGLDRHPVLRPVRGLDRHPVCRPLPHLCLRVWPRRRPHPEFRILRCWSETAA
jgi:hypothetical protein